MVNLGSYFNLQELIQLSLANIPHLILIIFLFCGVFAVRKIIQTYLYIKEHYVFLELTPPANSEKSSYTTQQLFSVIHNLGLQRSFLEKVLGKKNIFSFEIVSTEDKGIRYLLKVKNSDLLNIKRSIMSYLPHAEVKVVEDYLSSHQFSDSKVIEFSLKKHFAFPLKEQDQLYEHDPVSYITGTMTKLKKDELVSFQIVLTPIVKKEVRKISHMILRNEDVLSFLNTSKPGFLYPVGLLSSFVGVLVNQLQWAVSELINGSNKHNAFSKLINSPVYVQKRIDKPARTISTFEQEAIQAVQEKIQQPLFEVQVRALVFSKSKSDKDERVRGVVSSLATFSVSNYQSFQKKLSVPLIKTLRLISFENRLLSFFLQKSTVVLSVSEVASLYHFPFARSAQTENIVKLHSKQLPAPLSLKNTPQLDVVFAKNTYGGVETLIGLTKEERVRHMYVIGATGTGKSTMLLSMINQDLKNNKGICVVDPHGDLVEVTLNAVTEERIKDVIYFNPYDIKYPIGINLLELTPDLDEDESLIEKEFVAESVISLFRKVFSDAWSSHPHRIEYILRNTIHTAFTLPNPTLFTIFELLNNPVFQKKAIQGLQDQDLKNFWKYEFGRAGDYQKVKMVAPVTARIGRFLFSPSARRILEQEKSTINFSDILDSGKILICNLSKGNIGEDTSEVMGIMILNKLQLASLQRARVAQSKRKSFYLYVDEFQNFATPSFVQMLSEARKYGLNLVMAEQSTSQQKDKNLVQIILANTGTVVTFRSANPHDEELLLPQYRPYVEEGEIANLPSFNFYMKKAAMLPEEPFSGVTMPINPTIDKEKLLAIIQSSRMLYATKYQKQSKTSVITDVYSQQKDEIPKVSSRLPA